MVPTYIVATSLHEPKVKPTIKKKLKIDKRQVLNRMFFITVGLEWFTKLSALQLYQQGAEMNHRI